MRDALLDLMLGSSCTGCGSPGRQLCDHCASEMPRSPRPAWPTPCPPGLALPVAAGEYDGLVKVLINGHKERRQFALAGPLGLTLAAAVGELLQRVDPHRVVPVWFLVPVPSRGRTVRGRGHDPLLRVARRAAGELRLRGRPVRLARLLVPVQAVRDQAGLDAAQRAANLAGAMRAPARRAGRYARRWPTAGYLVVDDVVTTGATAREAQRALEGAGLPVSGVAAVAATRRRLAARV